jgi:hypothetical protein
MLVYKLRSGTGWKCQWRHFPVGQRMLGAHMRNQIPFSIASLMCHKTVFLMSLNVNIASVVSWRLSECFVRKRQMQPFFLSFLLRSHLSRLIYYQIDIWKTPWGMIINNVCHVSVHIMELIWNIFLHYRFLSQTWRTNGAIFGYKINLW